MKTTKSTIALLFVLLGTQAALAWYDPSTQRWLSRDPMGEKGFEVLRAATQTPTTLTTLSLPGRWITRDQPIRQKPVEVREGANLYRPFKNSPLNNFDALGLGVACGSGLTSGLVPDKPGGYDFTRACKNHDKCYDCGTSKDDCDSQFLEDMQNICDGYAGPAGCYELANIYYGAVHNYGQGPWDNAQKAKAAGCNKDKCK